MTLSRSTPLGRGCCCFGLYHPRRMVGREHTSSLFHGRHVSAPPRYACLCCVVLRALDQCMDQSEEDVQFKHYV